MNTKVKFLSKRADEFINSNECLEEFNELVNKWLEDNPCDVLDIKYNEVVSYIVDENDKSYKFPYTEYISAMIIYKNLD